MVNILNRFRSDEVGDLGKKESADHPDNQKLENQGSDSPVEGLGKKRRCTDILFLLLLICSWCAMTGVGLAATGVIQSKYIKMGDPRRLSNGMDYYGNLCGVTNYETPRGEDTINLRKAYSMPSGFSVCIESCPSETDYDNFICEYEVQHEIDTLFKSSALVSDDGRKSLYLFYASRKQCMPLVESMPFLGYCLPRLPLDELTLIDSNITQVNSTTTEVSIPITHSGALWGGDLFDKAMADVTKVRFVIFGFGCGVALLLGIVFLVIIQLPGFLSLLVWSMIFAIDVGLVASGQYTRGVSLEWAANGVRPGNEAAVLFYASYVLFGLAALWLILILFMRKRIVLAISCVREAAKAIASMPVITIFPVVQVLGLIAFTVVWGIYMAYLASSGEIVAQCMCPVMDANVTLSNLVETVETSDNDVCDEGCIMHKELMYSMNTKYAALYMLFAWFWTSQFIVAVGQIVVALATSLWYFNRNRSSNFAGNSKFFKAVFLVLVYHLGTAAFGSLIIAIVKTIRAVLTYVQTKASKSKLRIAVVILSVLKCLVWCIEKCLKFINKQAYIQTAIFGYSFCKASRMGFFLILRNALRISAVSVVSQIVLFISKVFVTLTSAVGGYYYLSMKFGDELNYLMLPTLLVGIVAYAVSEMFNEVFGMAISTILQCFVADEELFDADERFSPASLVAAIESTQQKYKKKTKIGVSSSAQVY